MTYQVFARKYRPQTFEEVIGQDAIIVLLRNAIRLKRFAQAYLFVGPRGIGKTSTARILAKALNCKHGPTAEPCGICDSCMEIAESRSLDVLEIDGASNNGVENVRILRENVPFSPVRGPFKIYIIDEVHMLSSGAFNALLKTLEEPPPHVKFIFATTEIQKVPATISSRCQRFDLKRISPRLMASHLQTIAAKEKIIIEESASLAIATAADGALRDAESMLDQAFAFCGGRITESDVLVLFGLTPRQTVADLSAFVLGKKTTDALALVAEQGANGRDFRRLLEDWMTWLRDILIQQAVADKSVDPAIQEQATLVSQGKLLELLDLLAETQSRIKWASDPQLQMDVAVIKATHLLEQADLDDVLTTLSLLGAGNLPPAFPSPATQVPERNQPAPPPLAVGSTTPNTPAESTEATQKKDPLPIPTQDASATTIWKTITTTVIQESPFKFAWLAEGRDITLKENTLHVCFPKSLEMQSIFWKDIQATLEKQLSQKRGIPTCLKADWLDLPPQESSSSDHPSVSSSSSSIEIDSMENFKNDPLIRKALEIFKGTIQTARP